jgi:hypothetical protein
MDHSSFFCAQVSSALGTMEGFNHQEVGELLPSPMRANVLCRKGDGKRVSIPPRCG